MKKTKLTSIITLAITLVFSLAFFAGCASTPKPDVKINAGSEAADPVTGGTLLLKVNPEIAISYDENGNVTAVSARNNDAKAIIEAYDFSGKDTKTVVSELVTRIGEAGYFIEEVDGEKRTVTIEIENGSVLPSEVFLDDIIANAKKAVDNYTPPAVSYGNNNTDLYDDAFELEDTVEKTLPSAPSVTPSTPSVEKTDEEVFACTNPYCDDIDCDDIVCDEGPENDVRTCTNPYCDDTDCDDIVCDEGPENDVRTCTNPYCDDTDCDDIVCDEGPENDVRTCTNPYCDDTDCDDIVCDEGPDDYDDDKDIRTCTNPYCYDDDCDDVICNEDDRYDD